MRRRITSTKIREPWNQDQPVHGIQACIPRDDDGQDDGTLHRAVRRAIVVSEFVSQDGVVDDPSGREGYEHGGWTVPWHNREIDEDKKDELFGADAMLLGRVTYEAYAAAWPSMTDEDGVAERMSNIRKFVVSSTLKTAAWNNSTLLSGGVIDAVTVLKRRPGRDLLVAGCHLGARVGPLRSGRPVPVHRLRGRVGLWQEAV
jgi:dihydrofolate reductase